MTIKPNRTRAFLKTFVFYAILISVVTVFAPLSSGSSGIGEKMAFVAFGSAFFGLLTVMAHTPREITWDDDGVLIRRTSSEPLENQWRRLEAYSPFAKGLFLIKFEGRRAFQIDPSGFSSSEWKVFQQFIRQRFPEKKAWVWAGPLPMRFGNKKI